MKTTRVSSTRSWTSATIAASALLAVAAVSCGGQYDEAGADDVSAAVTSLVEGGQVLTSAIKIGDPNRARFPEDTAAGCLARSVWDMHSYQNQILIASGDLWNNSGAADIWALNASAGTVGFVHEYTVNDEMVLQFREFDGTLLVPGADSTGSWASGNLYADRGGDWSVRSTIPNALHVEDVVVSQNKLYAYFDERRSANLLESTDQGATWHAPARGVVPGKMMPLDDHLLIFGSCKGGCLYKLQAGKVTKISTPVFPTLPRAGVASRIVRFGDKIVYTSVGLPWVYQPSPLFYLGSYAAGARAVSDFGDGSQPNVRDVIVDSGRVLVLATLPDPAVAGQFIGLIYASSDLVQWSKLAQFEVPGVPFSFELLDGVFYVGLGTRSVWDGYADAASGSIWRIQ